MPNWRQHSEVVLWPESDLDIDKSSDNRRRPVTHAKRIAEPLGEDPEPLGEAHPVFDGNLEANQDPVVGPLIPGQLEIFNLLRGISRAECSWP